MDDGATYTEAKKTDHRRNDSTSFSEFDNQESQPGFRYKIKQKMCLRKFFQVEPARHDSKPEQRKLSVSCIIVIFQESLNI